MDLEEAYELMRNKFPNEEIHDGTRYKGLYVFRIGNPTRFDPYYSVDPKTGEIEPFSIPLNIEFLSSRKIEY